MASPRMNWASVEIPPRVAIAVRVVAWTTLVFVCGVILVSRSIRCREYRVANEAHNAEIERQHEAFLEWLNQNDARGQEILRLLHRDDKNLREDRSRLSREEVEQILNNGKPLPILKETDDQTYVAWIDPVIGHEWEFIFFHGELSGAFPSRRVKYVDPPRPVLPPAPHTDLFETYRATLVGFYPWQGLGPPAWLLLLAVWTFSGPFRKPMSELVLASALICTVFWVAHPSFVALTTWSLILNNDSLFWATLMLITSAVCVYRSYHSHPDRLSANRPLSIWRRLLAVSG